ncbi:hypothetical protein [Hymenobacter rigui]|uniref:Uncharacterized protein n=1 Tax=Hymenobacter rigui TaxID=334424 RepID=A0A428KXI0_9BACT|nr:hypothetical protein [Hymenobacter rigui]RSK51377.1 hypothetical protein EI291_03440 [Hymenobacter rigui]
MLPLTSRLGLSVAQHITGLSPMLHYRSGYGRQSAGFGSGGLLHTSVGLQYLDVLTWGPRWHVDAGLSVGYGYQLNRFMTDENWIFTVGGNTTGWPEPDQPLVLLHTQYPRRWTPLIGASFQVQYALTSRQFLLVSLDYQRGLLPLAEVDTRRLDYLDAAGAVQSGNLTTRHRGSYATAQIGYGWRLTSVQNRLAPWRTPRYHVAPPDPAEDDTDAK